MKREHSCCPPRYELPSLEPKVLFSTDVGLLLHKPDRSRRACRCHTDFFSISAVNVPSTHQYYLCQLGLIQSLSPATKPLSGFNSVTVSSFASCSFRMSTGLQTGASLKPRLGDVLGTVNEARFACPLACEGSQDFSAWCLPEAHFPCSR